MATATTAKKDRHLRHVEYYGLTKVFDKLYAKSKAQAVFTDLMPLTPEQIQRSNSQRQNTVHANSMTGPL